MTAIIQNMFARLIESFCNLFFIIMRECLFIILKVFFYFSLRNKLLVPN